jgi:ring-1,2-phenylacetyl-CoA epoxidase subunit PaaC
MNIDALKDLLYKMADDQLILGHRNSEWIGLGPILEEDIAFASMAQDKVGQSLALYELLEELGEDKPDTVAFTRNADEFHNCTFVELPIGEYDFSLIRHFLFDTADYARFELLSDTSYEPLQYLAAKYVGETRYHIMHADMWIKQLGAATEESVTRLQASLEFALPYALGIFEPSKYENDLINEDIFMGEEALKSIWLKKITEVLSQTQLVLPDLSGIEAKFGGRYGHHTEFLQPLLTEMSEVLNIDPTAEW